MRPGLYVGDLTDSDINLIVEILEQRARDRALRLPEDPELVRRLFRLAALFRRCSDGARSISDACDSATNPPEAGKARTRARASTG